MAGKSVESAFLLLFARSAELAICPIPSNAFLQYWKKSFISFSSKKCAIIEPLKYHINEAVSLVPTDTAIKGNIFLSQLEYLIGKENLMKTIKRYFADFKFTHPTPNDIKHTAEKVSGANLDWYLTEWTKTTNTIDYAIISGKWGDIMSYETDVMRCLTLALRENNKNIEVLKYLSLELRRANELKEIELGLRKVEDYSFNQNNQKKKIK